MSHATHCKNRPLGQIGVVLGALALGWLLASPSIALGYEEFPREWFWGRSDQRKIQNELVGQPAPKLELSEWMNEPEHGVDVYRKIVLIDFWATWCGPCIRNIPHVNEIREKYGPKGVEVIGVCGSKAGQEIMPKIVEKYEIEYPVARDATQESAEAWKVMWWPTYAIVDRKGIVRAVGLKPEFLEKALDVILKEQPHVEIKPRGKK